VIRCNLKKNSWTVTLLLKVLGLLALTGLFLQTLLVRAYAQTNTPPPVITRYPTLALNTPTPKTFLSSVLDCLSGVRVGNNLCVSAGVGSVFEGQYCKTESGAYLKITFCRSK
jgi:hypothetical protein